MTGRPKPTALKLIAGNPGKRPLNKREPKPAGEIGKPPSHFTAAQRKAWREIVKQSPPGVLTNSDAIAVEVAACLLEQLRRAPDDMSASRIGHLRGLLAQLGMTPADRSRLDVPPAGEGEPADDWDAFDA